jgi:hypothetical protein
LVVLVIPIHRALHSGGVVPAGLPAQTVMGFIDLQVQQMGLVWSMGIALI